MGTPLIRGAFVFPYFNGHPRVALETINHFLFAF
jgi:hypothetical protein